MVDSKLSSTFLFPKIVSRPARLAERPAASRRAVPAGGREPPGALQGCRHVPHRPQAAGAFDGECAAAEAGLVFQGGETGGGGDAPGKVAGGSVDAGCGDVGGDGDGGRVSGTRR